MTPSVRRTSRPRPSSPCSSPPALPPPPPTSRRPRQLDPAHRGQHQRLERRPARPGTLGVLRLRLVHRLLLGRPDNPLGFDFTLSCWHHDFGYRNYKAVGQFRANKDRVDATFYADLKRVCADLQQRRPARLLQPGLDLLPGGARLRLARAVSAGRPREGPR